MTGIVIVLAFGLYAEMTQCRETKKKMPPWEAGLSILFAALIGYGVSALVTAAIGWLL